MNEKETVNSLQIKMDDLATGQLGPLAAWRLRRHIARDPALAREFAEIRQLHDDLQMLVGEKKQLAARRPISPMTWTIGGLTMKRRVVLAAAAALTCATVTGAVAARHFLDMTPHAAFTDSQGRLWDIRTNLPGTIRLFNTEGRQIGQMTTDGGSPRGSDIVLVSCAGQQDQTLHGYGKHLLRSRTGAILGSLNVSPLSAQDKQQQAASGMAARNGLEALYREPNTFTANAPGSGGKGGVTGAVGLTAGHLTDRGISWKLIGYAMVTADYLTGEKPEHQEGRGSALPSADSVPFPARGEFARLMSLAPPLGAAPQLYWQIAGDNHTIEKGTWRDLRRTGSFTGYGKHEVKDENGKTVLVLTVSPLTPPKPAR